MDLPETLARIVNLKAFADASKINRRTLYCVMQRENEPTAKTRERIEKALRELKPAMRRKEPKP